MPRDPKVLEAARAERNHGPSTGLLPREGGLFGPGISGLSAHHGGSAAPESGSIPPHGRHGDQKKRLRHRPRRRFSALLAAALVAAAAPILAAAHSVAADVTPPSPPNVLLLVSDDQTWSTFGRDLMPNVTSQLVDEGVLFTRAYDNSALCCPSRSEILTGLYEHHTGVDENTVPLERPTIVQALHAAGYRTSLTGKYLNSWPCDARPEFDQWACYTQRTSPDVYLNPLVNLNGTITQLFGYATDLMAQYTADFIRGTPPSQPFFAMYTPMSPHLPANDVRCAANPVAHYRPPSFDEDVAAGGKPQFLQRGPLTPTDIDGIDTEFTKMTQAVECVDPAIGTILDALGDRESSTLVVYLSDNGYLYGEHRIKHKRVPYEEAVRVPFIVRYPDLHPTNTPAVSDALVQNVDIAPTIAELAGIHWGADGRSLVPLLTGEVGGIRDAALVEACQGPHFPCDGSAYGDGGGAPPSVAGVVTGRYAYLRYVTDEEELYDLSSDPFELTNLAGAEDLAEAKAVLQAQLASLMQLPPPDTTIVTGPSGVVAPGPYAFTYFSQSRWATYWCRLTRDGVDGSWFGCDGQSIELGSLADGTYAFAVSATDEPLTIVEP